MTKSPLQHLTAAALLLPGLLQAPAHAEEDSVDFQYSHYQESKRTIHGMVPINADSPINKPTKLPNNFNPLEVDSLHGSSRITLTDRIKFAFNYTQDTWSGATPISTAPVLAGGNNMQFPGGTFTGIVSGASPYARDLQPLYFDRHLQPLQEKGINPNTGLSIFRPASAAAKQLVHTLTVASPETRKQGDFKLGYEWDEAALDVGGGISVENDYESRFASLGGRMDFNQKQTSANLGVSYTNSDTFATLDPDSITFIPISFKDLGRYELTRDSKNNITGALLRDNRVDWGSQLGLTQIINPNALLKMGLSYTRSTGYMSNPYKGVTIVELSPTRRQLAATKPLQEPIQTVPYTVYENRPDERNQFNWNAGYVQYIKPLNAALHFDYRFAHDDWDINAHTFEADWVQPVGAGWTITPRIRYYSQSSANFYTPYVTVVQVIDNRGNPVASKLNRAMPTHFSSDQRLSAFGALSGGVTVSKQFAKGVQLEAGFEYYSHAGNLKLGGGGEDTFADFNFFSANAALKVNLESLASGHGSHEGHEGHAAHHGAATPAGIMFDHVLPKAGNMMVGYRFMRSEQAGDVLLGSHAVSSDTVQAKGCGDQQCALTPNYMAMNMHMLDLMYAPIDWMSLMLMPQWMDMEMKMTPLSEASSDGHNHGGAVHGHQTGGIGDTGLYALFKLFNQPGHQIILGLGGTAPTGDVDITLRKTHTNLATDKPIHYGMQLGSGTWDFKPSLTYIGELNTWSWGAQVTGTKRLEDHNESNFAFGDMFQSSVWGAYQWRNWLATTVRSVYSWQDALHGAYRPLVIRGNIPYTPTHVGPFDNPANYGGQFVDLGLGVNVTVPSGAFAGSTLKFEWLQPLHTAYNGYQLDRDGALSASWSVGF